MFSSFWATKVWLSVSHSAPMSRVGWLPSSAWVGRLLKRWGRPYSRATSPPIPTSRLPASPFVQ